MQLATLKAAEVLEASLRLGWLQVGLVEDSVIDLKLRLSAHGTRRAGGYAFRQESPEFSADR